MATQVIGSKKIIFENDFVEALCIQFKRNRDFTTYKRICGECINLIDSIIRKSKFHEKVPFLDLRNWLFLQFERWIDKWIPGEGKIYSYFAICTKHGCLSFITKEKLLRQRYVHTDVPLESLSGDSGSYEQDFDFAMQTRMKERVREIHTRWHEPVIRECLQYMASSVLAQRGVLRRRQILKTATTAYPIDIETAKFLLDWMHGAVRQAFLELYDHPMSFQDVMIASEKWSFMKDVMSVIGFKNFKKLACVFAGATLRFPSPSQIMRYGKIAVASKAISIDQTPESIELMASKLKTSGAKICAELESILENLDDGILDDRLLFSK